MKIERAAMVAPITRLSIPTSEVSGKNGSLAVSDSALKMNFKGALRPLRPSFSFEETSPGTYSLEVPFGVTRIKYDIRGAGGGGGGAGIWVLVSNSWSRDREGGRGGEGARLQGELEVEAGDLIGITVGQRGAAGANSIGQNSYVTGVAGGHGQATVLTVNNVSVLTAPGGGRGTGGRSDSYVGSDGADRSPPGGGKGGSGGYRIPSSITHIQPQSGEDGYVSLQLP